MADAYNTSKTMPSFLSAPSCSIKTFVLGPLPPYHRLELHHPVSVSRPHLYQHTPLCLVPLNITLVKSSFLVWTSVHKCLDFSLLPLFFLNYALVSFSLKKSQMLCCFCHNGQYPVNAHYFTGTRVLYSQMKCYCFFEQK